MFAPRQVSAILLLLVVTSRAAWAEKEREVRQFNGGYDASYSSGGSTGGTVMKSRVKECSTRVVVEHARVRCAFSGCRVRCHRGYKLFPGRSSTVIRCDHFSATLTLNNAPWHPNLTPCLPDCGLVGCLNGGRCVKPGQCQCSSSFTGDHCHQQTLTPGVGDSNSCPDLDYPVTHATIERTEQQMVVKCDPGFTFKIGGKSATIQCRAGTWDLPPLAFHPSGPLVCQSECNPPCGKEGKCVSGGVCDCPPGYRGPECQLQVCPFPRHGLAYSTLGGNLSRLRVDCHPGRQMLNGRRWDVILCRGDEWTVPGRGLLQDTDLNCYLKGETPA